MLIVYESDIPSEGYVAIYPDRRPEAWALCPLEAVAKLLKQLTAEPRQ